MPRTLDRQRRSHQHCAPGVVHNVSYVVLHIAVPSCTARRNRSTAHAVVRLLLCLAQPRHSMLVQCSATVPVHTRTDPSRYSRRLALLPNAAAAGPPEGTNHGRQCSMADDQILWCWTRSPCECAAYAGRTTRCIATLPACASRSHCEEGPSARQMHCGHDEPVQPLSRRDAAIPRRLRCVAACVS